MRLNMICLAVTYVMKPGTEEETVKRLQALTAATRAEAGCRFYQAHRSTADPRRFFLYEQYDDQAALEFHRSAPYFVEHVVNGLMMTAESRSPELYHPLTE
jgi:(4S)-4-hydroxy-5-phosphonooxypentane-2,3-dione isomerase